MRCTNLRFAYLVYLLRPVTLVVLLRLHDVQLWSLFAVSQTLDDFCQRLELSDEETAPLKQAITAIETGNSRAMTSLGMTS